MLISYYFLKIFSVYMCDFVLTSYSAPKRWVHIIYNRCIIYNNNGDTDKRMSW